MSSSSVFNSGFSHLSDVMYVNVKVSESSLNCLAVSGRGQSIEGEFSSVIYHGTVGTVFPLFAAGFGQ